MTFVKHDSGKVRMDLLPIEGLEEVGKAMSYGAIKYADHNWRQATSWNRYSAAALRHMFAWLRGEDLDPESGLNHLAHAGACILMLLSLVQTNSGNDGRWKPEASK